MGATDVPQRYRTQVSPSAYKDTESVSSTGHWGGGGEQVATVKNTSAIHC